jgi:hypothetical protein
MDTYMKEDEVDLVSSTHRKWNDLTAFSEIRIYAPWDELRKVPFIYSWCFPLSSCKQCLANLP